MKTLVSTGQITITDTNDYLSTGSTPPSNPIIGITLWCDTSVTPNQFRKWNGSTWEIVNEVIIGGRNLVLNSKFGLDYSAYGGSCRPVNLIAGETYTLSMNGNTANALNGKVLTCILYNVDWSFQKRIDLQSIADITNSTTFVAAESITYYIDFYYMDSSDPRTGSVRLNWVKLEIGNKATDYTPAPEDVTAYADAVAEAKRVTAQAYADGIVTVAEANAIAQAQVKVDALVIGGRNLIIGTSKSIILNSADWVTLALSSQLIVGKTYILGGTFTNTSTIGNFGLNNNDYGTSFIELPINTPFIATADMATRTYFAMANQTGVGVVSAVGLKLELGNKATDYTPAPEDVDASILAAQEAAAAAQSNLDNLKIAGNNLLLKSNVKFTKPDGVNQYLIGYYTINSPLIVGNTYTLVSSASNSNGGAIGFWVDGIQFIDGVSFSNETAIKYTIFVAADVGNSRTSLQFYHTPSGNGGVGESIVNWACLYDGNVRPPLAWISSQEDINAAIAAAQAKAAEADYLKTAMQGSTDIAGGLLLANVIEVKDDKGNVTGGMSGIASDPVFMFGGGNHTAASNSAANPSAIAVIDRKDGSGHRAFGKLLWDKLGNLTVSGILNVLTGGKIGNFSILDGKIVGSDLNNVQRLVISTDTIPDIASLGSSWAYADMNGVLTGTQSFYTAYYGGTSQLFTSATFNLPYPSNVIFDLGQPELWFDNPQFVMGYSTTQSIVVKQGANILYSGLPTGQVYINASGAITIEMTTTVTVTVTVDQDNRTNDVSGTLTLSQIRSPYYQEGRAKSEFGSNGFYSYWTSALYMYFSSTLGFNVRGKIDIPGGLGGASINDVGQIATWWGKIDAGGKVVKSANNYTITHNIGDVNYSIIMTPISTNVPYFSSKTTNTIIVTCAGGFDFVLIRTQ